MPPQTPLSATTTRPPTSFRVAVQPLGSLSAKMTSAPFGRAVPLRSPRLGPPGNWAGDGRADGQKASPAASSTPFLAVSAIVSSPLAQCPVQALTGGEASTGRDDSRAPGTQPALPPPRLG